MVSRARMGDLMNRLMKTYKDTGGTKFDEEDEDTSQLTPFDAQKLKVAKMIQKTKEFMKERDELLEKKKNNSKAIKMNQTIRKMIKMLKEEHKKMAEIQQKSAKPKLRLPGQKKDPNKEALLQKQKDDVDLVLQHVKAIEEADKNRNASRGGRGRRDDYDENRDALMDGEEDMMDGGGDGMEGGDFGGNAAASGSGGGRKLMVVDDPEASGLPELDISDALAKVEAMKKEIDKGLDQFSKALDELKDITKQMGDELDAQNKQLDDLDKKVDATQSVLDKLNEKQEKANQAVGGTLVYVIVIVVLIIIIALVVVGLVVVLSVIPPVK